MGTPINYVETLVSNMICMLRTYTGGKKDILSIKEALVKKGQFERVIPIFKILPVL